MTPIGSLHAILLFLNTLVPLLVRVESAKAINFWLSESGTIPTTTFAGEVPELLLRTQPGALHEIHVWGRPDMGQGIWSQALNLRSTNSEVLDFVDLRLYNPLLLEYRGHCFFRFQFALPGQIMSQPDVIDDFGGFTIAQIICPDGLGFGALTASGPAADPFHDVAADAWLIATVTFRAMATGNTNLMLQIGRNGIVPYDAARHQLPSERASVVFGDATDPPLNGLHERGRDSATPDARIGVVFVPEPASLWLTIAAALGMCRAHCPGRCARPSA